MMDMDLAAFRASLSSTSPPSDLSPALRALWQDARGDWDGAHDAAQADEAYWYRRATKPVCKTSLTEEWVSIATALLAAEDCRARIR
jgi:hypothetical protein